MGKEDVLVNNPLLNESQQARVLLAVMERIARFDSHIPHFTGRRIPKQLLSCILESQTWVPSARNIQPIDWVVITQKRMIHKVAALGERFCPLASAPLIEFIVGDVDLARQVDLCSRHLYTTASKGEFLFLPMDGACVAHAGRLSAAAHGLCSSWHVGLGAQTEQAIGEILDIPSSHRVLSIVAMGYPADDPPEALTPTEQELLHVALRDRRTTRDYDEAFRLQDQPACARYLELLVRSSKLALDRDDYRLLPLHSPERLHCVTEHAEQPTCERAGFALAMFSNLQDLNIEDYYQTCMRKNVNRPKDYTADVGRFYLHAAAYKKRIIVEGGSDRSLEEQAAVPLVELQKAANYVLYEGKVLKEYSDLFRARSAQIGRAAFNVVLMAHALDLQTCWISAFNGRRLAQDLGARVNEKLSAIVAIGKGKPHKVPSDQRTHWGCWNEDMKRERAYLRDSRMINPPQDRSGSVEGD